MDPSIWKSILQMANGGFMERVDYEMPAMIKNILDPNTDAKAKRELTIKMRFLVDETRQKVVVEFTSKPTFAPTKPLTTYLSVFDEETIVEMTPQIPGQFGLDGGEQEAAPHLKLIKTS